MTRGRRNSGWTMAEVIAVMVLISIVSLMVTGAGIVVLSRTEEREGEARLQRVLLAEQTFAGKYQTYTEYGADLDVKDVVVTTSPSSGPGVVSVALGSSGALGLVVAENSESCRAYRLPSPLEDNTSPSIYTIEDDLCIGSAALDPQDSVAGPSLEGTRRW